MRIESPQMLRESLVVFEWEWNWNTQSSFFQKYIAMWNLRRSRTLATQEKWTFLCIFNFCLKLSFPFSHLDTGRF